MDKDPNSPGQIQCKLCKLKIKYINNTSNIWDHLRRKHSTALEANKLATQIEELDDINVSNELSTSTDTTQTRPRTTNLTFNSTMSMTYENDSVEVESIDATDNFSQFDVDENSGGEIVSSVGASIRPDNNVITNSTNNNT
ncbi:zinc finger BED domain-containing protein 1-like [Aphis craccivora]|uniref:Zinc finger BED domain-containing protein 1-like n=1 Tax=Aphis craccivora TaxID=307492 RepID=A0A6G0YC80_APHCR|nr:zinc finger BED domain-containing protein 1-like [Aphis craccivora]